MLAKKKTTCFAYKGIAIIRPEFKIQNCEFCKYKIG